MNCHFCNNPIETVADCIIVQMRSDKERVFNRDFILCDKCACGVLEKLYKADPMCSKCDADERAETD